jgi:hypothetical protein
MKTKIYGASDDLVEIEGDVYDEHGCYDHKRPIKISVSDRTEATIFYDGEWTIDVKLAGSKLIEKVVSVGDEGKHTGNALGCTSYSDVMIFEDGIEWVKIGSKTYNKS